MGSDLISCFIFRVVLPISLLAACITRANALSAIYLVFLLVIPLVPSPQQFNYKKGCILQASLLVVSASFIVLHIIFQIVLLSYQPYGHFIKLCTTGGRIANQLGFNSFYEVDAIDIVRLLGPDVVVFLTSLIAFFVWRKIHQQHDDADDENESPEDRTSSISFIERYLPMISSAMILLSGVMLPNVLSCVYFLTFLALGICWAFHVPFVRSSRRFMCMKILLVVYSGLLVLVMYLYQMDFFQQVLPESSFIPRLLGLSAIVNNSDCMKMRNFVLNFDLLWPSYVYPFVVFAMYWVLAIEMRLQVNKGSPASVPNSNYGTFQQSENLINLLEPDPVVQVQDAYYSSIMMFLMRQSYIASLIVMMTWSITFHSWLTFVMLLWACLTWITPFARWFCMTSSPYLLIYADLLLAVQFVYNMQLNDDELPLKYGKFNLSELGLERNKYPVLTIGVQALFSLVFLLTLRQHRREKQMKQVESGSTASEIVLSTLARPFVQAIRRRVTSSKKESNHQDLESAPPSDDAAQLILWFKGILAKYWIVVCCMAFLVVALQHKVSLYQIVYMVIFLMGFVVYKFSLRLWKVMLRPLWWCMVVYSIVILLLLYTYQFENMHKYWSSATGLSDKWLNDLGLHQQSQAHLLIELLIPTLFSIIIVVQLHFFHKPLLRKLNRLIRYRKAQRKRQTDMFHDLRNDATTMTTLTNTDRLLASEDTADDENEEFNITFSVKVMRQYHNFTVFMWRIAELHVQKLVCFVVMLVAVQQVSAINATFVILIAMAMPSNYLQRFLNYIMIVWSSIIVLVYMVYQLQFVTENMLDRKCKDNMSLPIAPNNSHFANNIWWVGLHKSENMPKDVRGYVYIVLVIVFEKVVKHHQELYRYRHNVEPPPYGFLFDNVTRRMADETISGCLKYLCNNFFTHFGFEINLMVMIVCMSIRGDVVAVIHSLWLALFLFVHRKTAAKLWTFYICYLALFIPLQYAVVLGWPPGLCKGYPWDNFHPPQLIQWFYLTNVQKPQDQSLLLADYFQFLVACCQMNVFKQEVSERKTSITASSFDNTVPVDFMQNKTWLDFVKMLVLNQFMWFTLSIVYITAQTTTSLFNSGFIVGCFFFLWHGQALYLRPRKTMKRWWKLLLFFNFFVIVAKVWLQLVSCVYIDWIYKQTDCYIIQLLNLYCLRSNDYKLIEYSEQDEKCFSQTDTGMMMDSVCFIVAMIQYLILKSSYFKFVIREHRRQADMASRGAQLVEERSQVHLKHSILRDKQMMQTIKNKVLKLKQRLAELNPDAQEPLSHYEAIYSGDYYLFEESDAESDSESQNVSLIDTTPIITYEEDSATVCETSVEAEIQPTYEGVRKRKKTSLDCNLEASAGSPSFSSDPLNTGDEDLNLHVTIQERFLNVASRIASFFNNMAESAISFFDETSSDYRSIAAQLSLERVEKAKFISRVNSKAADNPETDVNKKRNEIEESSSSGDLDSNAWSVIPDNDNLPSWNSNSSTAVRLLLSFYNALLANSDLLCYTLMIINHMYYASVLSMPLPFFVFLWGMLSIPRPNKQFWIVVITYVELVIVVKYIFQFQLPASQNLNFNECDYYEVNEAKSPLCPPRIIGIERNQYTSVCDLLLLLGLFFHRFALKAHGLWREKAWRDEEDLTPRHKDSQCENNKDCKDTKAKTDSKDHVYLVEPEDQAELACQAHSQHHNNSILQNVKRFIHRMLDPEVGTGGVDVYAWMFGAQFIVFVIILSSWSAFSSSQETKSNFAKIIEENVVPKTFLYMLLTQFLLMLFDRYLYMRKYVFVKFVYLAVLVFLFHIFIFIIVPELTQRLFISNTPAIFMYLFQCIYFALSAYQVRCGYPTRILGNFLTKNYTITSAILFQGIQAIPFLLELRSVLDWVCTKTTLTLNHWLKMEDIYANVFILKCWRDSEKTWPHARGVRYWTSSKWLIGGLLVLLLIVVIWFPLLFMSFINSAYISNRPVEATFTLTLGGYQPLFKVTTQQQFLKDLSTHDIDTMIKPSEHADNPQWDNNKVEQGLQEYKMTGNIMRIKVLSNSSAIWTISPPSRNFLIDDLESNSSISLRFKYVFSREPTSTQAALVQETVSGVTSRSLHPGDPIRKAISDVLKSAKGEGEIKLPRLFPTFIQVPARGPVKPVGWLGQGSYVNCTIVLRHGSITNTSHSQVEWWEIVQDAPRPIFSHDRGSLEIIALNDLVPPLHLSFFASRGIIGLYVGFVWLVGKFVRLFFTSISYRIMFDEVPNVDRILKLILEIYMVRESKELKLEEDLFAKLLFLYRSPETLIKWTKYKRL